MKEACFFQILIVVFVSFRSVPEARSRATCRRQIVFDGGVKMVGKRIGGWWEGEGRRRSKNKQCDRIWWCSRVEAGGS